MSETAWAHLPDARLIDEILADFTARPEVWGNAETGAWRFVKDGPWAAAWTTAQRALSGQSLSETWLKIEHAARNTAQKVERSMVQADAQAIVQDLLLVLIAWPSSAALLPLTPDALRTIIDTCDGDVKHQAVLLLTAVIARHTT